MARIRKISFAGRTVPNFPLSGNRQFLIDNFQIIKFRILGALKRLESRQNAAFGAGGHGFWGGDQWAALHPLTIKKKGHATRLVDSGAMSRANKVIAHFKLGARGMFVNINFRNLMPYSGWHQQGTTRMPQRKVLEVLPFDRNIILREIANVINTMGL